MTAHRQSMACAFKACASAPQTGWVMTAASPSARMAAQDMVNVRALKMKTVPPIAANATVHFNGEGLIAENLAAPPRFRSLHVQGMASAVERAAIHLTSSHLSSANVILVSQDLTVESAPV